VRSAAIKAHEASVFVESHETSLVGLFKDITAGLLTSGVISILAGVTLRYVFAISSIRVSALLIDDLPGGCAVSMTINSRSRGSPR